MTESILSPSLQQLIDARLDTIEKYLLNTTTSRSERRDIIQSVEDQVDELVRRRDDPEPTRESILAVLAMIEPPEAYLDLESPGLVSRVVPDAAASGRSGAARPTHRWTPLAAVSFVLGLICLLSIVLWPVSVITGMAAAVSGSIALTQIYYAAYTKGVWLSVIGVCSPAIAVLAFIVLAGGL